ncbi:methyl-accepting chemotaxis protein [Pseudomonas sp. FW300-N1A1]|nr:methyl-accepting chemotaxis protein [Pseudomonas sp. FW300-N1A1]POA17988.1 methyl-accepting chemotaxis protein [Pseudomonas sp. FW300-N1A1]
MKQWKVRTHLLLLAGTLLTSLMCIGALGLYGMRSTVQGLETVYLDRVIPLQDLKKISELYSVRIVDAIHKARDGAYTAAQAAEQISLALPEIEQRWLSYQSTQLIADEVQLISEITPLMQATEAPLRHLQALLNRSDLSSPSLEHFAARQLYPLIDPLTSLFSQLTDAQLEEARKQYELSHARYEFYMKLEAIVLALTLLFASLYAAMFCARLVRYLGAEPHELAAISTHIAQGQLFDPPTITATTTGVMQSVEAMRRSLRTMIGKIREASRHIEASTRSLGTSSEQGLKQAAEQTSAASSIAAAAEQMSANITHIAESAVQARDTTQKAEQITVQGIATMDRSIIEMQQIAQLVTQTSSDLDQLTLHSNSIGKIVDVIHNIAEQTNLLALNAAIEAARAGEQGRGFAVVAEEVRELAIRTTRSTAEIVTLVTTIQSGMRKANNSMSAGRERVLQGQQLIDSAGASMNDVKSALDESLGAVSQISHALQEQRAASEDVARNVETVAQRVEENVSAQQDVVTTTHALKRMSSELEETVRGFILERE